jgi:superfamily II DNA or RNA helicase
MSPTLRPYQIDNVAALDALAPGDRVLSIGPTGAGKTIIFAELIKRQVARYKRALVIAHRREIIAQTSRKLFENGVRHGIIQPGFDPRPMESVQVASIQTLHVRAIRSDAMRLPPADLVIIDEAHHSPANTYSEIIESYPEATIIGFTATPCRGDGRGLGGIFKAMIEMPQVAELIEQKYLVPTLCYAPVDPDLTGVRVQAGDYAVGQLERRMNTERLVGDIVTHWHQYGQRRPTVVFAVGVAHSIHLRDEFLKSGVAAEHIDGGTPKEDRDAILKRLASGETTIVSNCMVLTEGWDCPEVGCTILARPTKSMGLFRQMVGRAMRPAPGKVNTVLLDHSGAVYRHGLPEDHVEWTLNPAKMTASKAHESRKSSKGGESKLIECTQCSTLRLGGQPCPHCGFLPMRPPRAVDFVDGDLALVGAGPVRVSLEERRSFYGQLRGIACERGHKSGWAAHKYREKFGTFPPWDWNTAPHEKPQPATLAWVRSRQIAWRHSPQNPRNQQHGSAP